MRGPHDISQLLPPWGERPIDSLMCFLLALHLTRSSLSPPGEVFLLQSQLTFTFSPRLGLALSAPSVTLYKDTLPQHTSLFFARQLS